MPPASDSVTMVKNAIHNPADARHFMRIAAPDHLVTARIEGIEIARSQCVLKLKEVGYDIYDPVLYFPRDDVAMQHLRRNDKSTHCPLKGDTEYFDFRIDELQRDNIAWSYDRTLEFAAALKDYIGFDTRLVQIIEHTVIT